MKLSKKELQSFVQKHKAMMDQCFQYEDIGTLLALQMRCVVTTDTLVITRLPFEVQMTLHTVSAVLLTEHFLDLYGDRLDP